MGITASQEMANQSGQGEEYKLTNLDVIHTQSILLGLHNSINELHTKQNELKRLISVQNSLFAQQNEVIKTLVSAVSNIKTSLSRETMKMNINSKSSSSSLPPLQLLSFLSDEHWDECVDFAEPSMAGIPEKDRSTPTTIKSAKEPPAPAVRKDANNTGNISGCAEGVRKLFTLDVSIILAKINQKNMDESTRDFHTLLSRGPIGEISQFELAVEALIGSVFEEPARAPIISRLIQKTAMKLSFENVRELQKSCKSVFQRHLKECHALEEEVDALRSKSFESGDKSLEETIFSEIQGKHYQRNRRMFGVSRFAVELYTVRMIHSKTVMEIGDDLLKKSWRGDDVAACCLHSMIRKVDKEFNQVKENSNSVNSGGLDTRVVIESQWLEKVYRAISSMADSKNLSMSTRIALADLLETRNGRKVS